ncbi:unnamed protein product [Larinioides sclopetarius]|uniref:Uncharacterized protein n=1 Tax=Larinioides sclopetarius TaxID=280406 RepID=A0AAV1ZD81_9ARAC
MFRVLGSRMALINGCGRCQAIKKSRAFEELCWGSISHP